MQFDYRATAHRMHRQFVRFAWTTTQQKWTTGFILGGLILALIIMPSIGIAVFGTAFAGWGIAVFIFTIISGLTGNRIGIGREKNELKRQVNRNDSV